MGKDMMLAWVSKYGNALQCANEDLKKDKEVVLAAVTQNGLVLKFAEGGLSQDDDCLKAAGLFDGGEAKEYERREKAILSNKFSLGKESSQYATEFALALKQDKFLCQF